ncbi:MAG UNVERIFIED_CONTAM: hypothetical protein LVQ98_00665 [Rickettsiaceae bacterium]
MSANFLSTYDILFNNGRAETISPPPQQTAAKGVDPALTRAIISYCREQIIKVTGDPAYKPTNTEIQTYKKDLSPDIILSLEADIKAKRDSPEAESDRKLKTLIGISNLDPQNRDARAKLEQSKFELREYLAKYSKNDNLGKELFGTEFALARGDTASEIHKAFDMLEKRFTYFIQDAEREMLESFI